MQTCHDRYYHQLGISTSTVIRKLNDFLTLSTIFLGFQRLCLGWVPLLRDRWFTQDLTISISSLFLGTNTSYYSVAFATIDVPVRWKSLRICLSYYDLINSFAFEFSSGWFPDCFNSHVLNRFRLLYNISAVLWVVCVSKSWIHEWKSHEYVYQTLLKLIQQIVGKLSDKRFIVLLHALTNKEILDAF